MQYKDIILDSFISSLRQNKCLKRCSKSISGNHLDSHYIVEKRKLQNDLYLGVFINNNDMSIYI